MNQIDHDNMRLLNKILEVKYGDKSNVERAENWKNRLVSNSPLSNDRGHKHFEKENEDIY